MGVRRAARGIVLGLTGGAAAGRRRLAAPAVGGLLVYAAACGAIGSAILGPGLDALSGHFLVLFGLGALTVFSVAALTSGLQGFFGFVGTGIALLAFLVASIPSAGGAIVFEALPTAWRIVGPFLPAGAGTTLVRNTMYFGSHHLNMSLVVLGVYAVIGVVLTLLAGAGRQSDTERDVAARVADAGAE